MPRFTFQAGDPLLASQLNTYLMDQAVQVFDSAAARTTALPSPIEGMVTYLKDVDLVQVWDGSQWDEISGGGSITVSSTAPSAPEEGDLWFNDVSGKTFVYYTDSDGSQWVEVGQAGGLASASVVTSSTRPGSPIEGQVIFETDTGAALVWDGDSWEAFSGGGSIEISATAPSSPDDGDLWWDSDNGNLYIYYNDGDSSQWVAANGPQVFVGTTAPAGYQGQLWFDSTEGKTYIYYDDGTSAQWVSAIGGSVAGSVVQVVSTTKTDTFTSTSTSFTDITGLSASITPKSASNKILVLVSLSFSLPPNGTGYGHFKLTGGNTSNYVGDAAGSRIRSVFGGAVNGTGSISAALISGNLNYLDSPATTSSTTYQMQAVYAGTGGIYINRSQDDSDGINRSRGASTITLMEIAG